jgi:hypothetical protein
VCECGCGTVTIDTVTIGTVAIDTHTREKRVRPDMQHHNPRVTALRGALAAGALSFGIFVATGPLSPGVQAATVAPARAARTISLDETGHLHLTSKHNFTLNEQGTATGTAAGTIYVHLTAVSSTRVTAEVNIYPHGGSISGYGTASYHRSSTTAGFSGSMSINHGTGSYAGAHGSGLSFSGTIAESNRDAITVHVSGAVSD